MTVARFKTSNVVTGSNKKKFAGRRRTAEQGKHGQLLSENGVVSQFGIARNTGTRMTRTGRIKHGLI
jgi:hypothetical protein